MGRADKPAFPGTRATVSFASGSSHFHGMTLREHYAGIAMQGIIANEAFMRDITTATTPLPHNETFLVAKLAAGFADALIAELGSAEEE